MTLSKISASNEPSSIPREGSLLRVIKSGGLWCEPDLYLKNFCRVNAYRKNIQEVEKRCRIEKDALVLCLSNESHPFLRIQVLRFFYEERCYTFKGYYLTKDYFEVVTKDAPTGS